MSCKVPMVSCIQWVLFHTYIGCDVISQVGLITQINWYNVRYSHCVVIHSAGEISYTLRIMWSKKDLFGRNGNRLTCWCEPEASAVAAKSLQSCPTLCDPIDGQPTRLRRPWDSPGKNSGVGCHFLLQRMKVKVKVKSLSSVRLFATPWTAAHQAPPSMGFSRQKNCSGLLLPSPRGFF